MNMCCRREEVRVPSEERAAGGRWSEEESVAMRCLCGQNSSRQES